MYVGTGQGSQRLTGGRVPGAMVFRSGIDYLGRRSPDRGRSSRVLASSDLVLPGLAGHWSGVAYMRDSFR